MNENEYRFYSPPTSYFTSYCCCLEFSSLVSSMRDSYFSLRSVFFWIIVLLTLTMIYSLTKFDYTFRIARPIQLNYNKSIEYSEYEHNKIIFLNDEGFWNFSVDSFVRIEFQADLTPDFNYFLRTSKDFIGKYPNNTFLFDARSSKDWQHKKAVGVNMRTSNGNKSLLLISQISSVENPFDEFSSTNQSFLYVEMWTTNYHKTSSKSYSKNSPISTIPFILSMTEGGHNKCCILPINHHLVEINNEQFLLIIDRISVRDEFKIWLHNLATGNQQALSIRNKIIFNIKTIHLTPFVKKNRLYLIESYKPLSILQCSIRENECRSWKSNTVNIDSSVVLYSGTQLVQYLDTHYFVGVARSIVSCNLCSQVSRAHIVILSSTSNRFRLIYVSEVLPLDQLPMFSSLSVFQESNGSDPCYGLVRRMTPGSIVGWDRSTDKLTFTLSINGEKSFLVNLNGVETILQFMIDQIRRRHDINVLYESTSLRIVSHSETSAKSYCQDALQKHQLNFERARSASQDMGKMVIKDILDSPTQPSFRVVSNAPAEHLKAWITSDSIHFGLIRRYLEQYESIHSNPTPGTSMMIDAGGNHGTYAFYGAKLNQTVHIFEVLPKYLLVLRESIRMNTHFGRLVIVHPYGISDQYDRWKILPEDGTTRLDFLPSQINDTVNQNRSDNILTIETYPLDEFIFQKVSIMKIDVEGFEIRALRSADRAFRIFGVGAILIEIAPNRWHWNNVTIDEGISVLEHVSAIGHYSNYLIAREDFLCPQLNMTAIAGVVQITNLSMISMETGHLQSAFPIYEFRHWASLVTAMKQNAWVCNFWLESDPRHQIISSD